MCDGKFPATAVLRNVRGWMSLALADICSQDGAPRRRGKSDLKSLMGDQSLKVSKDWQSVRVS